MAKRSRCKDIRIQTGWKQNRTGRKQEHSRCKDIRIRTGWNQDRSGRKKQYRTGCDHTERLRCKDIRIPTGWKSDQNGRKGDCLKCIQTHGEDDRFVHMLSLACNEVALAFFFSNFVLFLIYMPFVLSVSSSDVRALLLMPTLSSLYCGNIDKIGSIVERYWQSKVEVLRLQLRPYQENTELTPKIQELHALVCASCYTQYELLVLQNQLGFDSPNINYQQLKSPLQSLSQEEMITGDREIFFL